MNARSSARIIPLPGAAIQSVIQHPRRGRYPAIVTKIRRGYHLKFEASLQAKAAPTDQELLKAAEGVYQACKHMHDAAWVALLEARQRASREVKM